MSVPGFGVYHTGLEIYGTGCSFVHTTLYHFLIHWFDVMCNRILICWRGFVIKVTNYMLSLIESITRQRSALY
jgi:hypothetical protein